MLLYNLLKRVLQKKESRDYSEPMQKVLKKMLEQRLSRSFFMHDTPHVAQALLGKLLIHYYNGHLLVGKIVETESYRSDDPASHAFIGKTERNSALFGPVGHSYVYIIYGLHYGFNVVAREKKFPAGGVLIRALEPLIGIDVMQKNRGITNAKNLTNGPGKLTQAFKITKALNDVDLMHSETFFLAESDEKKSPLLVKTSPRIGISKAKDTLWRFYIQGNPFVSYHKKLE